MLRKKISFHRLKQENIHLCQKMKVDIQVALENGPYKEIWKRLNSNCKNRDIK